MTAVGRSGRRTGRGEHSPMKTPHSRGTAPKTAPESLSQVHASVRDSLAAERRTRPVGSRRLNEASLRRLDECLSERDHAVLASLATYRFLTTTQLRDFHFDGHRTAATAARVCRRVLARLRELQLIEELERRVGGVRAGSDAFVWRVGLAGDRLLRLRRGDGVRARRKEPSARFLDHCLDIASTHLKLLSAARAGQLELVSVTAEPRTWRDYLGPGGERLTLKPDLLATTAVGDFEDRWAFEIDEATESVPTLIRKCAQYEAYRSTGQEQATDGVFPLVVWIVPTEARAQRLDRAMSATHRLDRTLYRICTPDRLLDVIRGGAL